MSGAFARAVLIAALALAAASLIASPAAARMHKHYNLRSHSRHAVDHRGPTDPSKDAALIVDGASGRVLLARNATALRHPASLTKMMTLYMLFGALQRGQVTMQTLLPISEHAAEQSPTKMGLAPGDAISVEDAIKSIVIHSANDIAVAIAESLGGPVGRRVHDLLSRVPASPRRRDRPRPALLLEDRARQRGSRRCRLRGFEADGFRGDPGRGRPGDE